MEFDHLALQTSPIRAAVGTQVAARLRAAGAECLAGTGFDLWYQVDFLAPADCAYLIRLIDQDRQPSTLLSDDPEQDFRTSESCHLDRWNRRVRAIDQRICALVGLNENQGETLQGQRYAPGQFFRAHHDFFHTDQAYWPSQQASGGQRTWTAMIFLNEPEAGGDTVFVSARLTAAPRSGMLLMWNNMGPDGAPNLYSAHEGQAVEAGVKYIVTKWFREGHWI